jgi:RNA polymerase sigma-70 factor (ECF subfamily)
VELRILLLILSVNTKISHLFMQKTKHTSGGDTEQRLGVFQYLFNTCYHSLVAYAYKMVDDVQDAEDVVQDVFMTLWIGRDAFDFDQPVKPYLFKAVYNRSVNLLKSRRATLEIAGDGSVRTLHEEITLSCEEDSLLLKELSDGIERFIDTLPPQCKKVFRLSRMSGLGNREIAEALNISGKTVEAHIGKALRELRAHLKKTGLMTL